MADYFQSGSITTLQNITKRPLEEIEHELRQFAPARNMVLLLPALYSEFEGPAMPKIINEIGKVDYLSKIVVSLDKAEKKQFQTARSLMSKLPGTVRVVWHDGPRMLALYDELRAAGFRLDNPGKGRSVWMALGYILSDPDTYAIGLHDTDIINYTREIVARLFYPVVNPALDYEFSKGYYARVAGKFFGRVTRLFYTPLIRSLEKILGHNLFLDFLDSFRFALSGEFAFISTLAGAVRISPTWGLEVSILSEVYSLTSVNRIAQTEMIDIYEHKHQVIDRSMPDTGLIRMAEEIAKTLLRVLTQDGIVMSGSFFRTLLATYIQECRYAIVKYNALSLMNGLPYDRHEEIANTEAFAEALKRACIAFIEDPIGVPMLPAWVRVRAALPEFQKKFVEAIEADNNNG